MPLLPPGVNDRFPADAGGLSPLFRQYVEIKAQHPGALLLYRLGDFFELFGPDAVRAAEILDLTLTSRACSKDYKVAMCGVPHHSAVRYIKRLVTAGEVVAICEQTEDPALAKGLVERNVTRVITAGTLVEDEYLSEEAGNFLAAAAVHRTAQGLAAGVAVLESSGGQVELYELPPAAPPEAYRALIDAMLRHRPSELLLPETARADPAFREALGPVTSPVIHTYTETPGDAETEGFLTRYFGAASLSAYGLGDSPPCRSALFALIRYLRDTFRIGQVRLYPRMCPLAGVLYLDSRTIANLELLETLGAAGSATAPATGLLGILDRCRTAAGRRLLRQRLAAPSADAAVITSRHDAVGALVQGTALAGELAAQLDRLSDIERIVNRTGLERSNPRELRSLADSLPALAAVVSRLENQPVGYLELLHDIARRLGDHAQLHRLLDSALAELPPVRLSDGTAIRAGADSRVDELRALSGGGKEWFSAYEQRLRDSTGIRTLRIKQTPAFGYFIEVSKPNLALVPDGWQRKQTLTNAERFTTPELAKRETELRNAERLLLARETELYDELCGHVSQRASELVQAARAASELDSLASLAAVARERGWVRPQLAVEGEGQHLAITGGRHPLVEEAVGARHYTPGDCYLDSAEQQIAVLTGPNMGGKSTYLRMVAVLAVINQLGGFVPAESALLPVFRRIYTRVGAQDYLVRAQSTFMVEMVETAGILNTCGEGSLVLLDEVGRGTSTYDGISIAKAVVEHLHEHPARPLTLFATHFLELTDLAVVLPRVRNLQVEVAWDAPPGGGEPYCVFLYRVVPGAASDSFGIEVAAMAGLPPSVVSRARAILAELAEVKAEARERARRAVQMGLFGNGV